MEKVKEGDLYGIVTVYGKTFEIFYGYYEEYERHSRYNEPVPVYPDLKGSPQYAAEGFPIVTEMQIACPHYSGRSDSDSCGRCSHFQKGERLFGLCKCPSNMRKNE